MFIAVIILLGLGTFIFFFLHDFVSEKVNTNEEIENNLTENENIKNELISLEIIVNEDIKNSIKKPYYTKKVYNEFIALDFETTGLDPASDKIIEVAALKFKDGQIVEEFQTLVNPQISIPGFITFHTGITNEMVQNCPTIEEIMPELLKFIGKLPLVAHNASFDIRFLKYNVLRIYKEDLIHNPVIDTLRISRTMFPELPNHKLPTVVNHLEIDISKFHRSYNDSFCAAQIYLSYCKHKQNKVTA